MDMFTDREWRELQEFFDCPNRLGVTVELLKQMSDWITETLALPFLTAEEAANIIRIANERAMALAEAAKAEMESMQ